jgi:hypothetical protein
MCQILAPRHQTPTSILERRPAVHVRQFRSLKENRPRNLHPENCRSGLRRRTINDTFPICEDVSASSRLRAPPICRSYGAAANSLNRQAIKIMLLRSAFLAAQTSKLHGRARGSSLTILLSSKGDTDTSRYTLRIVVSTRELTVIISVGRNTIVP